MMYPYMTLSDGTEIVHSQIIEQDGLQKVIVHFERPTDNGFDSARCELPSYRWLSVDGFSAGEVSLFEQLLRSNFYSNADVAALPVKILGKVVELRGKF